MIIRKYNNQKTNVINNINDLSGNTNNNINDVSGNLADLIITVTDLSENVSGIEIDNTLQDLKLICHGVQISADTDALVSLGGIVTTNVAATGANTVLIDGIILTLGISGTAITPSTGIYGSLLQMWNILLKFLMQYHRIIIFFVFI